MGPSAKMHLSGGSWRRGGVRAAAEIPPEAKMGREIPGSSLPPAHCSPAVSPTSEPSRKPARCNLCPPQSRTEQRKGERWPEGPVRAQPQDWGWQGESRVWFTQTLCEISDVSTASGETSGL